MPDQQNQSRHKDKHSITKKLKSLRTIQEFTSHENVCFQMHFELCDLNQLINISDVPEQKKIKITVMEASQTVTYILSQAIQSFVQLLCECQVMQHLVVLLHSSLDNKEVDKSL